MSRMTAQIGRVVDGHARNRHYDQQTCKHDTRASGAVRRADSALSLPGPEALGRLEPKLQYQNRPPPWAASCHRQLERRAAELIRKRLATWARGTKLLEESNASTRRKAGAASLIRRISGRCAASFTLLRVRTG
jgi:hypothetical protein